MALEAAKENEKNGPTKLKDDNSLVAALEEDPQKNGQFRKGKRVRKHTVLWEERVN